jgi:DNA-binding LacI/PurR family transcriptional regulator/DNA-binding transcriptional regulator YhcF (GntR family)
MDCMNKGAARVRAREYILNIAQSDSLEDHGKLPSVRAMAGRAGVSELTMWRAVRELADQGILVTRQGSGIRVVQRAATPEPDPLQSLQPWQRVSRLLERDIEAGEFRFLEGLPSVKELTVRYGVAYRTLRKALRALQARRVIQGCGRWYRVSTVSRRSRDTVVLIARGSRSGGLELPTPRMEQQLRVLHGECARAGVTLKAYGSHYTSDGGLGFSPEGERAMDGDGQGVILGYILWSTSLPAGAVILLVDRLAATRKPVSLLDEGGDFVAATYGSGRSDIAVFTTSNSAQPGLLMGRYLCALGHRKLAYLTLWPTVQWSANRESGLRLAMEQSDPQGEVVLVAPESPPHIRIEELQRLDRLLPALRIPSTVRDQALSQRLLRAMSASSEYFQATMHWQDTQAAAQELYPKALALPGVTTWVAGNDLVALGALRYLASQGVKVPRDLSVAGFDDTPEAFASELTSYNFNLPAIAHAMLHHILGPRGGRRRGGPVEIEGYVSERASSTVPPGAPIGR